MTANFSGKVALVQGASSGMGRVTALALAAAGAEVIVAARNVDACEAVCETVTRADGTAVALPVDVTDSDSVAKQFEAIRQRFGRLDLAFNNVGATFGASPTHETPVERFVQTLDVNLTGMFRCMQHEIALMLESGGGSIVNNSSIGGRRGFENIQDYCASKWGVIGLTKSSALEYAKQGIRINAIAPGLIATEKFETALQEYPDALNARLEEIPTGAPGSMEQIASTVSWLLSDQSKFVTGEVIAVDGGECAK